MASPFPNTTKNNYETLPLYKTESKQDFGTLTRDQRNISRTLLRSVGKNALTNSRTHVCSALNLKTTSFEPTLKKSGTNLLPKFTSTATISIDELERLRHSAFAVDPRLAENEEKRRTKLDLKDKSKAKMANWSNTIQGYMAQRERANIERLEREEFERREKDIEEHELNRERRHAAIQKAYTHAHNNMDNVKALHSKMLLSDVMQEREIQARTKERKETMLAEIDR
jgi:Trichohyalin-plectin-homology domain